MLGNAVVREEKNSTPIFLKADERRIRGREKREKRKEKRGNSLILTTLTFRSLRNEVEGTCLGAQVLPAAVHPHVHDLTFLVWDLESEVPV